MKRHNIILAHDLTNDFVSGDPLFQNIRVNVGRPEIMRLFGKDKKGKLPHFLELAHKAQEEGQRSDLVFIRSLHDPEDPLQQAKLARYGNHNLKGTVGAQFVEPVTQFVKKDNVMDVSSIYLPIDELQTLLRKILGADLLKLTTEEREQIRLLLVGVHTDKGILNLASLLRNQFDLPNVAVCPHLVGSSDLDAHRTALQKQLPDHLVKVIPGTHAAGEFVGLSPEVLEEVFSPDQCRILPELADKKLLNSDQRRILISMFVEYEQIQITFLGGGYSGSLLLAVEGEKSGAKTKRVIVKLDHHPQMRREIQGYEKVRDYLGNNIPTFISRLSSGEYTGVAMDVASISGPPKTMQSIFETSKDSDHLNTFLSRLEHILGELVKKLYANTKSRGTFSPYKAFGLDNEMEVTWLQNNIENIATYNGIDEELIRLTDTLYIPNFIRQFAALATNKKQVESEVCLVHGDLNFANLITDDHGNVWTIDWTHTGEQPVEIDFAKMENNIKFIMIKEFTEEDLNNLRVLEGFLIDNFELPSMDELPSDLSFVKEDFKFQKLYLAVKMIRETCIGLKTDKDAFIYRAALLKYSLYNLSFDRRMGKGKCKLPQLKYALLSTSMLVEKLAKDPFHKEA